MCSVKANYLQQLQQRGYQSDPAQLAAVDALERCASQWAQRAGQRVRWWHKWFGRPGAMPQGVYMHGGVGRGKSFLMDCFFEAVPIERKTRLHFHEFMREVHRELNAMQGTLNPLDVLGQKIAKRYQLICFDEFHVSTITDAMILHRLLVALFANGVGLCTTSNFEPMGLYPNGLHRDRVVPAMVLLSQQMQVVGVDHGVDYRRRTLELLDLYKTPIADDTPAQMQQAFEQLASGPDDDPVLHIEGRALRSVRRAGGVVWFDFATLCGGPRSQNDYLELATQFHTLLLSDVPVMPVKFASQARRLTWLIDVLYDRRVKLLVSAHAPAAQLYTEGPLAHEFPRTVSRLAEMQSAEFLALAHRTVTTDIT